MSNHKEDADVILLEQRFPVHKSACDELGFDAELIVLDSVESSSDSSVEEIVPCNDDSPVVCFTNADNSALHLNDEFDSHLRDENVLLLNEINRLKEENSHLRNQLEQLKDVANEVKNVENDVIRPHVQVIFRTEKLAKKYKHKVNKCLKKLFPKDVHFSVIASQENKDTSKDADIFCLDTRPLSDAKSEHRKIPSYENSFESPMQKELEVVIESKKARTTTCFNCLGDHILSKCQEPWDQEKINENRRNFFKSNLMKSPRYHVDKQISDKFRPGEISKDLRSALNLKPNQLPPYIYRMRSLGYPPGWMKEAEIESSGILIYGEEGKVVADDSVEDGEVDSSEVKVQYDPKKLVSYPGFNVPLPPGIVDESSKMGFPPMQHCHLRSEVEKSMKPPEAKAYRKRKLTPISSQQKKIRIDVNNRIEDDMEIEGCSDGTIVHLSEEDAIKCTFVPPLPVDDARMPPPPPVDTNRSVTVQLSDSDDNMPVNSVCDSPSLKDLENAKNRLMEELDLVSDEGTSSEGTAGVSSPSVTLTKLHERQTADSKALRRSNSLFVNHGTPVLLKYSSFSKVPESSQFAIGISEHLCFENLPNSTGQYEKMRKLIGKIRDIQKTHT